MKIRKIQIPALALMLISVFTSCSLVKEDLEPCPEPVVELRFIYDYNMNRANAFHSQVDCLTVYFFNADGEMVKKETVTNSEVLSDENYRMYPDLPPGDYRVVAYGGMECAQSSFIQRGDMQDGSHYSELKVQLDPQCLTHTYKYRLHNQYYGMLEFTIDDREDTHATVEMMRNTNSIQVALQHENTQLPIDHKDYIFEIIDDNNDFDHENNLIPTGEIMYQPWLKENRSAVDVTNDNDSEDSASFHAAVAQFTTSRLVLQNRETKPTATRLTVRRAADNEPVFSIPLVSYMLMFKHDNSGAGLDDMGDQEYLDRENTWNFVFFIKDGMWVDSHIIINNWEVRMNRPEF